MDTNITFSQKYHPPAVPRPGHAPLVLEAQIGNYDMSRVFMDRGSSMNIIFSKTLREMFIPTSALKTSDTTIYGIVPGKATSPLGKISLDVIFGDRDNFRRENLDFKVVDWTHSTTRYSVGQHSPDSWPSHTTPTSSSRCPDKQESSQSVEVLSSQTDATKISIRSLTPLERNKNSQK